MDKFSAIAAFAKVAGLGSFTAASGQLGVSPSAVTKNVSQLEKHLGVRLLNRTTHGVALTEEGSAFLARCLPILGDLADAERQLSVQRGAAAGRLRVGIPHAMARLYVTPHLPGYFASHPDIRLELILVDHVTDLLQYQLDLAIRVGAPRDGRSIAKELARTQRVTVATPGYLSQHGAPRSVAELRGHNCMCLLFNGKRRLWRFSVGGRTRSFTPHGNFVVNSGDELREAVLQGIGITQINSILVEKDLADGKLVPVLARHAVSSDTLYAVYAQSRYMPPRARSFVAFLEEVFKPFRRPSRLG
ncbi:HTH-type transcriptional regulator DmlR [Pigmentiphaga humi]|uniref:HTH-type transcriptional regulator DmlR n=1 Tax=Pigmentiphaga humi TaxID=2478468 RepID=A0A3P4B2H5_9BURK|nr:LysR family transcriptional regulator [Pigmentiphaga humi]VCU69766.1 HTH-type transcriptional regulator DmlR [Pigmentiphaga humi]